MTAALSCYYSGRLVSAQGYGYAQHVLRVAGMQGNSISSMNSAPNSGRVIELVPSNQRIAFQRNMTRPKRTTKIYTGEGFQSGFVASKATKIAQTEQKTEDKLVF
jgi:hypothetical protein